MLGWGCGGGVGAKPRVGFFVKGILGYRMSCIEPGLPSGSVTNGGAFCNKKVHLGGVWSSRISMKGGAVTAILVRSHQSDFLAVACESHATATKSL